MRRARPGHHETRPIELPAAYLEATEKYAAGVRLSADGRRLENYVAGRPFPLIDVRDPLVASKIMWNYEYKSLIIDDADLRNFDADTGSIQQGEKEMSVERHFLLDHLRTMNFVGRLFVDPHPSFQPNPEGIKSKTALYPILEPFDMKGVGYLS